MATYIYETLPQHSGELPERFEVIQSMKDAPLARHPDTGEPVRRVITGGYGFIGAVGKATPAPRVARGGGGCGCGGACMCGRGS